MTQETTETKTNNILWMSLSSGQVILTEYLGKNEEYQGVSLVRNPILIDNSDSEGVGFSEYLEGKEYNVVPITDISIISTTMANKKYRELYFEILADIAKSIHDEELKAREQGDELLDEVENETLEHKSVPEEDDVYKDYDPIKALEKSITLYFTSDEFKTEENLRDILEQVKLPSGSKPS